MEDGVRRISLKDISKVFFSKKGDNAVIQNISFDVLEDEFLVILGPGQCGKTLLLNIIAGLVSESSGEIEFFNVIDTKPGKLGFIFQRYALFPWKTVVQNVEMGLKFRGVPRKQRRKTANEFIRMVGLDGFENAHPKQLSGGMKQRVGIARAFANDSSIILMDEPFGALDAQTRYQLQEELVKIHEEKRKTIVFVTNNIEEAVFLADRIILLSGAPSSVKDEYLIELPKPRNLTDKLFLELRNKIAKNTDLVL